MLATDPGRRLISFPEFHKETSSLVTDRPLTNFPAAACGHENSKAQPAPLPPPPPLLVPDLAMNTTLETFEAASGSSRDIALLRRKCLEEDAEGKQGTGLANEVVLCLQESLSNNSPNNDSGAQPDALRVVTMIQKLTDQDNTLFEEISCSENFSSCLDELAEGRDDDARLQTIVANLQKNMSALETKDRDEPFSEKELQSRLPLSFNLPISENTINQDNLNIMVHQVTSEKETDTHDVGNVMWPASVMLARHITENPSIVLDNNDGCLELGAGCGLVGLTAAALLQQSRENGEEEGKAEEEEGTCKHADNDVIFTDYLPQVLENIERNLDLNGIDNCAVSGLDFFDQPGNYDSEYLASQPNWIDMDGTKRKQVGLVLAADVICYSNDATNVANTIQSALVDGGRALVVSPADGRRFGVEEFPDALRDAGLEVHVTKVAADDGLTTTVEESQDAELFTCVGYCAEGYNFLRFDITKPSSE